MLVIETGYFSLGWEEMGDAISASRSRRFAADWRKGADIAKLAERLAKDKSARDQGRAARVHNETATGMVLPLADVRRAMDEAKHPALLLSDTISSLGLMEYKMDAWGVDVTVGGSQKGLMLPTGMSFTGVSEQGDRGLAPDQVPRYYFNWEMMNGRAAAEVHRHRAGASCSSACRNCSR